MSPDYDRLRKAEVSQTPYPHFVVPGFLSPSQVADVIRDYPRLDMAGLFLPDAAPFGPAFTRLLAVLEGPAVRSLVAEKLDIDLVDRPTLATVRACCQPKDGRIHTDSKFKVATLLLYLNEPWAPQGGRLRILKSGSSLEDYTSEVAPEGGLLLGFKVQGNSWHGHRPFTGTRRYLMVNYCTDLSSRDAEAARHRFSGRLKKFGRLLGIGVVPAATASP